MDNKPILYDQYGFPIRREMLTTEVAGPTITGVRSPISGYPSSGLNPRRLAYIMREADQGDPLRYFELAEEIEEKDAHYVGVLGTRKRSVSQLDITIDAASDSSEHVKHADLVRSWLKRKVLQAELRDILDAIGKGISFTEIMWDTSSGQWWPRELKWRDPRWFRFDRNDGTTPLLRGDTGDTPLVGGKFITAVMAGKSGLPVRSGIARVAAWLWMFKAFTQRDWAIFTQTYGQPVRIGKYPSGASEKDKDTLFRAVANIAGDCAAIVPESMAIDFVESSNVGPGNDLYIKRCDWLDQQASKLVLGQTATTDAIAGGHAVGQEHREVQKDIETADANDLAAVLNRDLIKIWIDLEFGPQALYPELRIGRAENEDIEQLTTSLKELVPLGLKVQMSEVRDRLGFSEPDEGAELLTAPAPPFSLPFGAPGSAALQASSQIARRDADALEKLARDAEALAQPANDDMIDQVRAVVDEAESLDDLRDRLGKLKLPKEKLAAALRMALVMADLSGRAEIVDAAKA